MNLGIVKRKFGCAFLLSIFQWTSCQIRKIAGCACAGRTWLDACRDREPAEAGKTFPAFPAHAQPAILRIWQEAHGKTKKNEVAVYTQTLHLSLHLTALNENFGRFSPKFLYHSVILYHTCGPDGVIQISNIVYWLTTTTTDSVHTDYGTPFCKYSALPIYHGRFSPKSHKGHPLSGL